MGVRQLRDALQGVRPEGRAARPVREGRRRRPGPPLHRGRADRRAPHPVGPGRRLRRPGPSRRRPAASRLGTINSNVVPGRRLHARQRLPPGCRASAARRSTTCSPASTSWTRPARATSSCGSRTGRTTPARTTSAPARTGWPRRSPPSTPGSGRTSGWSSSTSSSSRRSTRWTCPTGGPPTSSASRPGRRRKVVVDTGHHAPGTNIEFIVASLLRADRLGGFDFNSRFYADDDLMVGSADPFQLFRIMHEVVQAGALDAEPRRRVHARPVPQHRAQDPGPDPLGDERPGGDGQGAARRRRGARRGAGDAATCWARTPS